MIGEYLQKTIGHLKMCTILTAINSVIMTTIGGTVSGCQLNLSKILDFDFKFT